MPTGRIAVGNGSCEILLAGRRGDARAGRRDRLRLAVVLDVPAPGRDVRRHARSRCRSNDAGEHDLEAMAARGHRRHAHGDRLQPEQPDAPPRSRRPTIDAFVGRAAAPRRRDPRRGLRRVLVAPGPRRLARPARAPPEPGRCCAPSRRSTASAACAPATRSARRSSGSRSTACASRSPSTRSRRPPRPRRSTTRTRSSGASSRPRSSACTSSRSSRERGLETTDSQANFSWVSLGDRDEDEIVDGLAKQGVIVRAGSGARRGGLDARHLRHAHGERPLPGGARQAAVALLQVWRCPGTLSRPHEERPQGAGRRAYWYWRFT